jgi:hypothetical protein
MLEYDIKYEFIDDIGQNYVFGFLANRPRQVDIVKLDTPDGMTYTAWLHDIENGEVIWRDSSFLSKEAKDYISRIVSLLAFA